MKICIDFQAGAHGNFLEFVCNKMAGVAGNETPFNNYGAAHNKGYLSNKIFYASHFSFGVGTLDSNKVIAIKIVEDDLLPLSQISLLRAGDYGFDNNELEIDTYNKLNNVNYRWVLDTIIDSFFLNQIKNSYNNVKDPSWPNIETIDDFEKLPTHIKQECIQIHKLVLLELNEQNPNCPRNILREFFEIGFLNQKEHGFIKQQERMKYLPGTNVYKFTFANFYDTSLFLNELKQIAQWAQIVYNDWESIKTLHQQFLEKQPYKYSKQKCDDIVNQMFNTNIKPTVNLIEESYINAMLIKQGYERRY